MKYPRLSELDRAAIGAAAIRMGHAEPGDVLTLPQLPDEPPIIARTEVTQSYIDITSPERSA